MKRRNLRRRILSITLILLAFPCALISGYLNLLADQGGNNWAPGAVLGAAPSLLLIAASLLPLRGITAEPENGNSGEHHRIEHPAKEAVR